MIEIGTIEFLVGNLIFTAIAVPEVVKADFSVVIAADTLRIIQGKLAFLNSDAQLSPQFPALKLVDSLTYNSVDVAKIYLAPIDVQADPIPILVFNLTIINTTAESVSIFEPYPGGFIHILDNPQLENLHIKRLNGSVQDFSLLIGRNGDTLSIDADMGALSSGKIGGCKDFQAPNLASISDSLTFQNNTFELFALPALNNARKLVLNSNQVLSSLELQALTNVDSLDVTDNANLENIKLSKLSAVSERLSVVGGSFTRCVVAALGWFGSNVHKA